MPLAAGVDLVDVSRIERSLARFGNRFLHRIFTPAEVASCSGRPASLAARFAAKEATAKLLGSGIGVIGWRDIEVERNDDGKPSLVLHGPAAAKFRELGHRSIAISLSHDRAVAIAMVVAD